MAEQPDDDEKQHYQQLRQIKLRNLRILEEQIEEYGGKQFAPPHVIAQRDDLRKALGIVDTVLAFPLDISDELDERGRFAAYIGGLNALRQTMQESMARVEQTINQRIDQVEQASMRWRTWGTIALIILVVIVVAMALIGVYQLGRLEGHSSVILWRCGDSPMSRNERVVLLERCLMLEATVHYLLGDRRGHITDTERVCKACLRLKPIKKFALIGGGHRSLMSTQCRTREYRKRKNNV